MTSPASSPKPDDIEEGVVLRPKFDAAGLLTCVTTDAATGEVLMVA
ncbi:MAG: phosphoribosyl-AMP cyclohydrolase, partial [Proteobacteria bacterium]